MAITPLSYFQQKQVQAKKGGWGGGGRTPLSYFQQKQVQAKKGGGRGGWGGVGRLSLLELVVVTHCSTV